MCCLSFTSANDQYYKLNDDMNGSYDDRWLMFKYMTKMIVGDDDNDAPFVESDNAWIDDTSWWPWWWW